jgi:hypothetical protein
LTILQFQNPAIGYKAYLDIPAAVDFMLANEISKNVDAYIFSTYFYKEKDKADGTRGKLVMGPLWDFNLGYGNVNYHVNSQFSPGWMYNDDYRIWWYRRLMQDPHFAALFACRWEALRNSWMTNDYFTRTIDSLVNVIGEARIRNYERWPILGVYVWPNQFVGQTYEQEINFMKRFIEDRLFWMDTNKPGDCGVITSVGDPEKGLGAQLFPNPTTGPVTISLGADDGMVKYVRVVTTLGQRVYETEFTGAEWIWNGQDDKGQELASGVYFISIRDASGRAVSVQRLIRR